jgi:hypothetical protein
MDLTTKRGSVRDRFENLGVSMPNLKFPSRQSFDVAVGGGRSHSGRVHIARATAIEQVEDLRPTVGGRLLGKY